MSTSDRISKVAPYLGRLLNDDYVQDQVRELVSDLRQGATRAKRKGAKNAVSDKRVRRQLTAAAVAAGRAARSSSTSTPTSPTRSSAVVSATSEQSATKSRRARTRGRRCGRTLPIILALALTIGLTGCGSSTSSGGGSGSSQVHFAKTKFVLHAGLAFGAFHRYIYKPYRNGGFSPPLSHKAAIVKAGVAALFVYHELKTALVDARSSPLLSKLVSPLTALQNKLNALHQSLRGGHLDSTSVNAANRSVSNIGSQSAQQGVSIHDLATSSLG